MANPPQSITIHTFDGHIETLLNALDREPLNALLKAKDPFRQLKYIVNYLNLTGLGAKSFLCESHYVDRDYMEDHGVFYSRSLRSYSNSCKRLLFFSLSKDDLIQRVKALGDTGDVDTAQPVLCDAYLGFVVVKPLPGAPIGRTVLRHLPPNKSDGHLRSFRCVRAYRTHVLGLTLQVSGLAFQQQDEGVSACATTAVWSSLQKIRDFEDIRIATPAEITTLASRHTLPHGRAMPSEGLSIDQMCQAIHAIGLAPNLYRPEARGDLLAYLHSAERSCFPSILVWVDNLKSPTLRHAVTVVGLKTLPGSVGPVNGLEDRAQEVRALYVHDDRMGPYLRADVAEDSARLRLSVPVIPGPF